MIARRTLLAAPALGLAGCLPAPQAEHRWLGRDEARGHRLRATTGLPAAARTRRCDTLVLGGGVAGLAALRAAVRAGHGDAQLLELGDVVGGNARGHVLGGTGCPQGAHYLPVPGAAAREVREWLHEIGLLRLVAGVERPDERQLCHSPQERLFIDGAWQDGLLPAADERPATLAQYRRFAARVAQAQREVGFSMPALRTAWGPAQAALDAQTFGAWLAAQGLDDERLLGYLDYCCRDDYGAGLHTVSAWAGLHYFASRHGFLVPGEESAEREAVFTWPEGNARLVQALARPWPERLHTGRTVLQVQETRHGVAVLAWDERSGQAEQWLAGLVVCALPLHVASRVCSGLDSGRQRALREAAAATRHAPWLVANLLLDAPLLSRPGAPPSWDNVAFAPAGQAWTLGYVDARHQSLRPDVARAEPPVITVYGALPEAARPRLLSGDAATWTGEVVAALAGLHPDLGRRLRRAELTRWGHAMAIPAPGAVGLPARQALRQAQGRVRFAHSDLAGYSVFEEAFTLGTLAVG